MIWLLALATSTSDSLNSTFSGQVQIETECARQRKISLQRRCEVYFPFFFFLFLSSTILLLLSLFVRCTTLRPNDFTLVSGGFVWARETTYVYIVQLEHVDAIGTSEVISHSLPFSVSPELLCLTFAAPLSLSPMNVQYAKCVLFWHACVGERVFACMENRILVFQYCIIIRIYLLEHRRYTQFTCTFTFGNSANTQQNPI